mgnify:CR=1 FL=1
MININDNDYRWYGLGYNDYNFIKNVAPRISKWLLKIYSKNLSYEETVLISKKLKRIAEIIDE